MAPSRSPLLVLLLRAAVATLWCARLAVAVNRAAAGWLPLCTPAHDCPTPAWRYASGLVLLGDGGGEPTIAHGYDFQDAQTGEHRAAWHDDVWRLHVSQAAGGGAAGAGSTRAAGVSKLADAKAGTTRGLPGGMRAILDGVGGSAQLPHAVVSSAWRVNVTWQELRTTPAEPTTACAAYDKPAARYGHALVRMGNAMLMFGGDDGGQAHASAPGYQWGSYRNDVWLWHAAHHATGAAHADARSHLGGASTSGCWREVLDMAVAQSTPAPRSFASCVAIPFPLPPGAQQREAVHTVGPSAAQTTDAQSTSWLPHGWLAVDRMLCFGGLAVKPAAQAGAAATSRSGSTHSSSAALLDVDDVWLLGLSSHMDAHGSVQHTRVVAEWQQWGLCRDAALDISCPMPRHGHSMAYHPHVVTTTSPQPAAASSTARILPSLQLRHAVYMFGGMALHCDVGQLRARGYVEGASVVTFPRRGGASHTGADAGDPEMSCQFSDMWRLVWTQDMNAYGAPAARSAVNAASVHTKCIGSAAACSLPAQPQGAQWQRLDVLGSHASMSRQFSTIFQKLQTLFSHSWHWQPRPRAHAALASSASGLVLHGGGVCTPTCECLADTWTWSLPHVEPMAADNARDGYEGSDTDAAAAGAVWTAHGESKTYLRVRFGPHVNRAQPLAHWLAGASRNPVRPPPASLTSVATAASRASSAGAMMAQAEGRSARKASLPQAASLAPPTGAAAGDAMAEVDDTVDAEEADQPLDNAGGEPTFNEASTTIQIGGVAPAQRYRAAVSSFVHPLWLRALLTASTSSHTAAQVRGAASQATAPRSLPPPPADTSLPLVACELVTGPRMKSYLGDAGGLGASSVCLPDASLAAVQRVVIPFLFGGEMYAPSTYYNDTWMWVELTPARSAADARAQQLLASAAAAAAGRSTPPTDVTATTSTAASQSSDSMRDDANQIDAAAAARAAAAAVATRLDAAQRSARRKYISDITIDNSHALPLASGTLLLASVVTITVCICWGRRLRSVILAHCTHHNRPCFAQAAATILHLPVSYPIPRKDN